jgi:hypothetical protein
MPRILVSITLFVLAGCGPAAVKPVPVTGTVTLDGKPLQEGRISFITPGQVPELIEIEEGRFEGMAKPGVRRVEIAAYRPVRIGPEVPEAIRPLMKDGKENYLPARYHRNSELTQTVAESGDNDFRFDLTSKKK